MRIDSRSDDKKKKDRKKKRESDFEKLIFAIMEKSMKEALDAAIDDLFKDWQ